MSKFHCVVFIFLYSPAEKREIEKAALDLLRAENADIRHKNDPARYADSTSKNRMTVIVASGLSSIFMVIALEKNGIFCVMGCLDTISKCFPLVRVTSDKLAWPVAVNIYISFIANFCRIEITMCRDTSHVVSLEIIASYVRIFYTVYV